MKSMTPDAELDYVITVCSYFKYRKRVLCQIFTKRTFSMFKLVNRLQFLKYAAEQYLFYAISENIYTIHTDDTICFLLEKD